MWALVWDGTAARVEERPRPLMGTGTALVRVTLAGICTTDLEITKGYMGFRGVLGHEFVGVVEQGPAEWHGKRVVGEINLACGTCPVCARGLRRHCPNRSVLGIQNADGAFAEWVVLPITNLHLVPNSVPDEAAVFTEPLAAAFEILDQVHLEPGTSTIILGDGKLGLLIAQVLHQAGARVLAVGRHANKLALLAKRGIETRTPQTWDRAPADLVVEATGSPEGFATAVQVTRARGTLVLKSTLAAPVQLDLAPLVINEITVIGSRCGSFPPALRALEEHSIDVESLVAARLPLRDGERALQVAASPNMLKVLLQIDSGQPHH
jgi:threonine dehydrogenase-like Zn-dependent dehydrogenase